MAEFCLEPSASKVGDYSANALAAAIIGLFKTEVIHHPGPWRSGRRCRVRHERAIDWFNNRHLLESIGNMPPAELEMQYLGQLSEPAVSA